MGKGRAPCCDKTKVKRGPWSPEEDLRLISFIQQNGHPNWRALPNQAGLRRCGKSCRLRWINYLRPDVKRGNITHEEEETIIKLHETYGNKWSIIASCMPGRTDNEIKNVWNTHLKRKFIKPDTSANITSTSSSYLIKKCKKTSSTVDPPTSPATSTLSSDVDDDQNNDKPTTSIKPINSNIEPTSNFQDVNHQYPPLQLVDPILSPTLSCVSNDPYQSALFQPPTDLSIELAPENNIIDPSMDYIWDVLELDGLWPHDGLNETHNSETHLTNDCDQDELIKGSNGRGSVANYSGAGEQKSNNSGNSGSKLQDWVRYLEMELGLYDHEDNPAN